MALVANCFAAVGVERRKDCRDVLQSDVGGARPPACVMGLLEGHLGNDLPDSS